MPGRSRFIINFALILGIALLAVMAGWWIARWAAQGEPVVTHPDEQPAGSVPARRAVHLYFSDSQGRFLMAEQRILDQPSDDVRLARQLIELLIRGPEKGGFRTLPADAVIRAVYLNDAGTAFIDFESDAFAAHPGGVGAELLSIYSMVNTLVLNVDRIRSVKFLVGGQESATLAGHVDLQSPFEVDMLWVR